jgi:hypothetical protein
MRKWRVKKTCMKIESVGTVKLKWGSSMAKISVAESA